MGEAALHFQCILKSTYLPCKKALSELHISHHTSLYACTEHLCICDNGDSLRISADADLSNALKCLESGKKSIQQLCWYVKMQLCIVGVDVCQNNC